MAHGSQQGSSAAQTIFEDCTGRKASHCVSNPTINDKTSTGPLTCGAFICCRCAKQLLCQECTTVIKLLCAEQAFIVPVP